MELQELMSLYSKDKMKSDSLYAIYQQLEKDKKLYTPQLMALNEESKNLKKREQKWKEEYMAEHPSVATYFLLMDDLMSLVDYQVHGFPEEF